MPRGLLRHLCIISSIHRSSPEIYGFGLERCIEGLLLVARIASLACQ